MLCRFQEGPGGTSKAEHDFSQNFVLTGDVVGRVDHLPHEAGETDRGPEGEAEPPAGDGAGVHEDHVDTGNVERHPGCEHDAGLGLPEVVHHGQHHKEGVVGSARHQSGRPHRDVNPPLK